MTVWSGWQDLPSGLAGSIPAMVRKVPQDFGLSRLSKDLMGFSASRNPDNRSPSVPGGECRRRWARDEPAVASGTACRGLSQLNPSGMGLARPCVHKGHRADSSVPDRQYFKWDTCPDRPGLCQRGQAARRQILRPCRHTHPVGLFVPFWDRPHVLGQPGNHIATDTISVYLSISLLEQPSCRQCQD